MFYAYNYVLKPHTGNVNAHSCKNSFQMKGMSTKNCTVVMNTTNNGLSSTTLSMSARAATMQSPSESTIMPSVTSTLTETCGYSSTPITPPQDQECSVDCDPYSGPLLIGLVIIVLVVVAAVTALVCCIYWRRRLKPKYRRRHTLVQRPNGRGPAAPAIEERYTTIAGIEEQPRRECDDNYAEVDEPAKKTQLGGGDNNHFYFILEGKMASI